MPPPPFVLDPSIDPSTLPHDSSGPLANGVAWGLFPISTLFLSLRLYCKYIGHRGIWWDDWILILSWVCHLISVSILSAMISSGYGKHVWDHVGPPLSKEIMISYVRFTFTITAAAWSKTAFAVTLLRITEGRLRWVIWVILISMNIIMGVSAMISWISCRPVQAAWDLDVPGECMDVSVMNTIAIVAGGYSAFCDVALATLPWAIIWKLQMKLQEKIGVGVAMSIGVLAGIMAAIKTSKIVNLATGDPYDAAHLSVWDSAEISVTIIAASIPALRVLIRDAATSAKRYYGRNGTGVGTGNDIHQSRQQKQYSTVVESNGFEVRDDDSDKSILASPGPGIYRVDEVHIKYEKKGDREEYEMTDRE